MNGGADSQPATPRLAATVLLLREGPSPAEPFEVLMVQRSAEGSFASALVFPGGVVDEDDWAPHWHARCDGHDDLTDKERAVRIAGLRECWEEAAVLAARGDFALAGQQPGASPLGPLMDSIGARFDLSRVAHFAHWVTPAAAPKRWDTHFLIARAPHGQLARSDGVETVGVEWISPQAALEAGDRGTREVLFSTRANLHLLAQSRTVDAAIAAARARPRFAVHPQAERRADGIRVFIPEASGYPVREGFIPAGSPLAAQPAGRMG